MNNIDKLKKIIQQLRDPKNGCPWDVKQDFESIAPHVIEEAYEVADTISNKNYDELKLELGDLLFQVIFLSQIADEEERFNFDDVVEAICTKMIKRHPHVFAFDDSIKTAADQEIAWEKQKEQEKLEKTSKNESEQNSILDGITNNLPPMEKAIKIQNKVSKVDFDWVNIESVFDKVFEELDELKLAISERSNIEEELGDVLFLITNIARKLKISPEMALMKCNNKFEKRFRFIEQNCDIKSANLEEMNDLWEKSKSAIH